MEQDDIVKQGLIIEQINRVAGNDNSIKPVNEDGICSRLADLYIYDEELLKKLIANVMGQDKNSKIEACRKLSKQDNYKTQQLHFTNHKEFVEIYGEGSTAFKKIFDLGFCFNKAEWRRVFSKIAQDYMNNKDIFYVKISDVDHAIAVKYERETWFLYDPNAAEIVQHNDVSTLVNNIESCFYPISLVKEEEQEISQTERIMGLSINIFKKLEKNQPEDLSYQGNSIDFIEEILGKDRIENPYLRKDEYEETCLHLAVEESDKNLVNYILNQGGFNDDMDDELTTPFILAVRRGSVEITAMLARFHPTYHFYKNAENEKSDYALDITFSLSSNKYIKIFDILLKYMTKKNVNEKALYQLLFTALYIYDENTLLTSFPKIQLLLNNNSYRLDINHKNLTDQKNILTKALHSYELSYEGTKLDYRSKYLEIIKFLLINGAIFDPECKIFTDEGTISWLQYTLILEDKELIKLLLLADDSVDNKVYKLYLENKLDQEIKEFIEEIFKNKQALHEALKDKDINLIKKLITDQNFYPNAYYQHEGKRRSALWLAINSQDPDIVKLFLEQNARDISLNWKGIIVTFFNEDFELAEAIILGIGLSNNQGLKDFLLAEIFSHLDSTEDNINSVNNEIEGSNIVSKETMAKIVDYESKIRELDSQILKLKEQLLQIQNKKKALEDEGKEDNSKNLTLRKNLLQREHQDKLSAIQDNASRILSLRKKISVFNELIIGYCNQKLDFKINRNELVEAKNNYIKLIKILLENRADSNISYFSHEFGKTPLHYAVLTENKELIDRLIKAGANIKIMDSNGKTVDQVANNQMKLYLQKYDINDSSISGKKRSIVTDIIAKSSLFFQTKKNKKEEKTNKKEVKNFSPT